MLRSRQFILYKISEIKSHIQDMVRRAGRNFKSETRYKAHCTKPHTHWLERLHGESMGSMKLNLGLLLEQFKSLGHTLDVYNRAIENLATQSRYERQVQTLTCYKGVQNVWALTMITEIGDIRRFEHPSNLVSWMGLDI